MNDEENPITHTIVDDPKTGKRVRIPVEKVTPTSTTGMVPDATAAESTTVARPTLKLVINPDESNPLTYTAAVKIGNLVLAVDDHDEETFTELVAQTEEISSTRVDAVIAYNATIKAKADAIKAKASADELKAMDDEIKAAAKKYEAIDAQFLTIGREIAAQKIKGIREADGRFYPVGDARPLRTLPARVALLDALAQRARLGSSDKDFLDGP